MKELELIQLYYYLCQCYDKELAWYCQRFSRNSSPSNQKITDEELLTIYFYSRRYENKHRKKDIYDYAVRYLATWFPNLPTYAKFNTRLNFLESAMLAFVPMLLQTIQDRNIVKDMQTHMALVDSLPIILCSGKRKGKVAPELSDKSYCSTKGLYYYGVKLHAVAFKVPKRLPFLHFLSLTPASENDLTALRPLLPQLSSCSLFADKAYCDAPLQEQLLTQQHTYIYTPVKLVKGQQQALRQFNKAADDLFSTAVSSIRQPIESLFNWWIEKTNFQNASKVRATNGLLVHIWGALATALLWYIF